VIPASLLLNVSGMSDILLVAEQAVKRHFLKPQARILKDGDRRFRNLKLQIWNFQSSYLLCFSAYA
jgi:hypothetical protein